MIKSEKRNKRKTFKTAEKPREKYEPPDPTK